MNGSDCFKTKRSCFRVILISPLVFFSPAQCHFKIVSDGEPVKIQTEYFFFVHLSLRTGGKGEISSG
jgi:hypothetical protein